MHRDVVDGVLHRGEQGVLHRMRKSGLSLLVDIQVQVDGSLTVREGHAIAHTVKDALLASATHAIDDVTVHIEPARG